MSNNRSSGIQKANPAGRPAGAIMTPQGPAVIQVIDIPTGGAMGAPMLNYGGPTPRKVGGINEATNVSLIEEIEEAHEKRGEEK